MNDETISPYAIIGKFSRIVKLWTELEKKPRSFGIDEDLHSSQIHMIEVIGQNRDFSVSDVAANLGVTKGAASQTMKKLESKGLIRKDPDPSNSSRMLVTLTNKGKVAYFAHEHWHETMDDGFREYFTGLSPDKIQIMDEILTRVEAFLKKM